MPVRLHHMVVDAHDLPALARFWAQALGWKVSPSGAIQRADGVSWQHFRCPDGTVS